MYLVTGMEIRLFRMICEFFFYNIFFNYVKMGGASRGYGQFNG
jgi:hypothetical protein